MTDKQKDAVEEQDSISRSGVSKVYKMNINAQNVREAIAQKGVKDAVMDFIFGKSDTNPLANVRTFILD